MRRNDGWAGVADQALQRDQSSRPKTGSEPLQSAQNWFGELGPVASGPIPRRNAIREIPSVTLDAGFGGAGGGGGA